jgi:hypothetical protein
MRPIYQFNFLLGVLFLFLFSSVLYSEDGAGKDTFGDDIAPCNLLKSEQVEGILPGHDGGHSPLSGGSLMDGIDSYQCTYTNDQSEILLVLLHVAADKAKLDWIKSHSVSLTKEISIGDGGWISTDATEIKLVATKGLKVVKLQLISSKAEQKNDRLIELASDLLEKL